MASNAHITIGPGVPLLPRAEPTVIVVPETVQATEIFCTAERFRDTTNNEDERAQIVANSGVLLPSPPKSVHEPKVIVVPDTEPTITCQANELVLTLPITAK